MSKDDKQNSAPAPRVNAEEVKAPAELAAPLDPAILDAINQAVMGAVKAIVTQIKGSEAPRPQPPTQAQIQSNQQPALVAGRTGHGNYVPPAATKYESKLEGIPVEPGQDLRHVHPSVINSWFDKVENRWKENMRRKGAINGTQANLSWTRGNA